MFHSVQRICVAVRLALRAAAGAALVAGIGCLLAAPAEAAGPFGRNVCPPGYVPVYPQNMMPNAADPNAPRDPNAPADPNADPNAANPNQMANPDQIFNQPNASQMQAASATGPLSPNMIGDFFGTVNSQSFFLSTNFGSVHQGSVLPGPNMSVGGRQKIQESTNPLPRDRVFFNYSFFDNVPLTNAGVNVGRYTLGVEKTFLDGNGSIELRVPMWSTMDSNVHTISDYSASQFEFGNINIGGKLLLEQTETCAVSVGMTATLPTADDIRIYSTSDSEVMRFANRSVHLLPFIGFLYTPDDRCFSQLLLQLDFDCNGNPVYVRNDTTGSLDRVGTANDANFLYLGWSTGYWIYRDQSNSACIRGLAPIAEIHWNRSIRRPDSLSGVEGGSTYQAGSPFKTIEATNLTLGVQSQLGSCSSLTVGYCTPLGGGQDQQFNGELRVLFNVLYGRTAAANTRASAVNFR